MFTNFPFFPHQASAHAAQVDAIYFFMVSVTAFFSLLIAGLLVFFAIKYHRRDDDEVGAAIHGSLVPPVFRSQFRTPRRSSIATLRPAWLVAKTMS